MTEHDRKILAPKVGTVKDRDVLQEFADSHDRCQLCGSDRHALQES